MQVKQLAFLNQFSVCLRRIENVLIGDASPHVEALNASETIGFAMFCPTTFFGDPPLRGSPGVLAPYGKRIEWQYIASCRGPECK